MSQEPKFHQISDALRAEIKDGRRSPGTRLPSEDELAAEYRVAINTVRNATRQLAAEGLIEIRPKSGTYVRSYNRIVRNANARLAAAQWGAGRSIWDADGVDPRRRTVEGVRGEQVVAAPDVAAVLGTSAVWARSRTYLVDGVPVQHATSYLPFELVEGTQITEVDTGPGGTYARLAELGFAPDYFDEDLIARMPEASESKSLQLLPMTPVAQLRRLAYAGDRVVEVNDMLCAADKYVFHSRISAS